MTVDSVVTLVVECHHNALTQTFPAKTLLKWLLRHPANFELETSSP